jgi:hypothetical protein
VSRVLAWGLFAATAVLLAAAMTLLVVGQHRGLGIHSGSSRFLFYRLGDTAALLTAGVGLVIAFKEPRNAIAWTWSLLHPLSTAPLTD